MKVYGNKMPGWIKGIYQVYEYGKAFKYCTLIAAGGGDGPLLVNKRKEDWTLQQCINCMHYMIKNDALVD